MFNHRQYKVFTWQAAHLCQARFKNALKSLTGGVIKDSDPFDWSCSLHLCIYSQVLFIPGSLCLMLYTEILFRYLCGDLLIEAREARRILKSFPSL